MPRRTGRRCTLVALFRAPHSFKVEKTLSRSLVTASVYIQQQTSSSYWSKRVVNLPSRRIYTTCFPNGKMDSSQSEAVADLIACFPHCRMHNKLLLIKMRGGFSKWIGIQTTQPTARFYPLLIELEPDCSEEDVEFADRTTQQLATNIETVDTQTGLIHSVWYAIKTVSPVAIIIGETECR